MTSQPPPEYLPTDEWEDMLTPVPMPSGYLHTDERADVLESVTMLRLSLARAQHNKAAWKWAIIAAHSALQGSLVVTLSGSDETGALDAKSQSRMRKWFNDPEEPYPHLRLRLATLLELLVRSQDARCMDAVLSSALIIAPNEKADIHKLCDLRDQFTHFQPAGLGVELSGLPRIIGVAARLSRQMSGSQPRWLLFQEPDERRLLDAAFSGVSELLVKMGEKPLPVFTWEDC